MGKIAELAEEFSRLEEARRAAQAAEDAAEKKLILAMGVKENEILDFGAGRRQERMLVTWARRFVEMDEPGVTKAFGVDCVCAPLTASGEPHKTKRIRRVFWYRGEL